MGTDALAAGDTVGVVAAVGTVVAQAVRSATRAIQAPTSFGFTAGITADRIRWFRSTIWAQMVDDGPPNPTIWAQMAGKTKGRPLPGPALLRTNLDREGLQVDRLLLEDPRRLLPLLLVVVEPCPGGDQLADDHVLLQATQTVDLAGNRRLCQNAGGLLERGRRQPD